MNQEIRDLIPASRGLLALGEPTHLEPSFGWVRNELFARLAGLGFRSIAMETDRVAALAVDDHVREGAGDLDAVMAAGFSHGFGKLQANRALVAWMREYNRDRPAEERLAFHGFDAPMETTEAPSPRRHLEYTRDYLGLDLDIAGLVGGDERWSRTEAIMDPAASPGATAEAERLRTVADDMLTRLYARAPELIAATSRTAWLRARTHLTAGLDLLRYHKQAAHRLGLGPRLNLLASTRDALMAQNLLDIRTTEAERGPTLVFAHNLHLKRNPSGMAMAGEHLTWSGAGAIVASLTREEYVFIACSLGRSDAIGLGDPAPDTFEAHLTGTAGTAAWVLSGPTAPASARTRTDPVPEQGYFPLDREILDSADAVLHIPDGPAATGAAQA
ncbi:erythromycin esterase family protein [Nocardiopsis sp. CNT-189]|uniref:erythromycin esterase family protein n=1 Tax=Nocardiopsis oceanisediminis TaxID=2816862 RepID=UPI003B36E2DE